MSAPRTQFLDYDARRRPRTNFSCVKCQKDLKPGQKYRRVQMVSGEPFVIHPEDTALVKNETEWHFIGHDCARRLGLEWTHPPQQQPMAKDPHPKRRLHNYGLAPLTIEQLEQDVDTTDIPELDATFFADAILTNPGEDLIKKVRIARKP